MCISLVSCERKISAYEFMCAFASEYPLDGVIYHSSMEPYKEGYISKELFKSIYIYSGNVPEDFAVYLNSRPERGGECGVFYAADAEERRALLSMCYERCRLICEKGTEPLVLTCENLVFYSTLSDPSRTRQIFDGIIK